MNIHDKINIKMKEATIGMKVPTFVKLPDFMQEALICFYNFL